MGEVGEEEDREGDEVGLSWLEVEALADGLVLSEEEFVSADDAFG